MDSYKIIEKLEHDLSHFLISEICKKDPSKRGSAEMYKYKGLNITADTKTKSKEKSVKIRIGALEAEFNINSGEKNSGGLSPQEEKLIFIWMGLNENNYLMKSLFANQKTKKHIAIVPFDLENLF